MYIYLDHIHPLFLAFSSPGFPLVTSSPYFMPSFKRRKPSLSEIRAARVFWVRCHPQVHGQSTRDHTPKEKWTLSLPLSHPLQIAPQLGLRARELQPHLQPYCLACSRPGNHGCYGFPSGTSVSCPPPTSPPALAVALPTLLRCLLVL